ncbi:MAG: hypothetical protein MUD08_12350 [Cytophagales bacterium]|jgi:hypothetical protein|nr:hypothetical protein [Cytophagales bacterium]
MQQLIFLYVKTALWQGYTYTQIQGALKDLGVKEQVIETIAGQAFRQWNQVNDYPSTYPSAIRMGWWSLIIGVFLLITALLAKPNAPITAVEVIKHYHGGVSHNYRATVMPLAIGSLVICFVSLVLGFHLKKTYQKESLAAETDLEELEEQILEITQQQTQTGNAPVKDRPKVSQFEDEEKFAAAVVAAMTLMATVDNTAIEEKQNFIQEFIRLYSEYEDALQKTSEQVRAAQEPTFVFDLPREVGSYRSKARFFLLKNSAKVMLAGEGISHGEKELLDKYMECLGVAELHRQYTYGELILSAQSKV